MHKIYQESWSTRRGRPLWSVLETRARPLTKETLNASLIKNHINIAVQLAPCLVTPRSFGETRVDGRGINYTAYKKNASTVSNDQRGRGRGERRRRRMEKVGRHSPFVGFLCWFWSPSTDKLAFHCEFYAATGAYLFYHTRWWNKRYSRWRRLFSPQNSCNLAPGDIRDWWIPQRAYLS